jgi:hypothetical protein
LAIFAETTEPTFSFLIPGLYSVFSGIRVYPLPDFRGMLIFADLGAAVGFTFT